MRPNRSQTILGLLILISLGLFFCLPVCAQQRVDPDFVPAPIAKPDYARGTGPVIWFDEGHGNLVTVTGYFAPMADVLKADGYRVSSMNSALTSAILKDKKIMVIGEPGGDTDPVSPRKELSVFSGDEIEAVKAWVEGGGRLLLLVDHMPTSGAAARLASAFGFRLLNGFLLDWNTWDPTIFSRKDGTLLPHAVTGGAPGYEKVSKVAAFFGSGFEAEGAEPILKAGEGNEIFFPDEPWRMTEKTQKRSAVGMLMGAVKKVGRGRIAVFSDASMFSAQISQGGAKMGMNHPDAPDNQKLLENTIRWLDR